LNGSQFCSEASFVLISMVAPISSVDEVFRRRNDLWSVLSRVASHCHDSGGDEANPCVDA
jgi:hypothetical protein